jgi:hypothetical protein
MLSLPKLEIIASAQHFSTVVISKTNMEVLDILLHLLDALRS